MKKIVFSNNSEIEVSDIAQTNDTLTITIDTEDVNSVIEKFSDTYATSIMRYYIETDLIRGYSGFVNLVNILFTPNVTSHINYEIEDASTESGFSELIVDRCTVCMRKNSVLTSVANQTAQNTANIDYLAMETGIEL